MNSATSTPPAGYPGYPQQASSVNYPAQPQPASAMAHQAAAAPGFGAAGGDFMAVANQYMGGSFTPYAQPMLAMGQQVVEQQFAKLAPVTWFSPLRYYFNVSNSYVLNKLKIVLCPFVHKNWKRLDHAEALVEQQQQGQGQPQPVATPLASQPAPPRLDVNAPDLYIPCMAFITYILLVSYAKGSRSEFTPELMASTASSGMVMLIFEVLCMKLAFYLLAGNVPSPSILDLTAYAGYKYVTLVLSLVVGLGFGSGPYFIANLLGGAVAAIFMMRTAATIFFPAAVQTAGTPQLRNYYLLGIGLPQLPLVLLMGRGVF